MKERINEDMILTTKRIVLMALLLTSISVGVLANEDPNLEARIIPRGSKVYIEPFVAETEEKKAQGFETYMAAALRKKNVDLLIVTDVEQADFVITGSADRKGAGWAKKVFFGDLRGSASASFQVINVKTKVVAYADASDKKSANRGYRSSAEKLAKYLKKKMESDEKKLKAKT